MVTKKAKSTNSNPSHAKSAPSFQSLNTPWLFVIIFVVVIFVAAIIFAIATLTLPKPFEVYRTSYDGADNALIEYNFGANPEITYQSDTDQGHAEIIDAGDLYSIKLTGSEGHDYYFIVTDDAGTDYNFHYYYNKERNTVILELTE